MNSKSTGLEAPHGRFPASDIFLSRVLALAAALRTTARNNAKLARPLLIPSFLPVLGLSVSGHQQLAARTLMRLLLFTVAYGPLLRRRVNQLFQRETSMHEEAHSYRSYVGMDASVFSHVVPVINHGYCPLRYIYLFIFVRTTADTAQYLFQIQDAYCNQRIQGLSLTMQKARGFKILSQATFGLFKEYFGPYYLYCTLQPFAFFQAPASVKPDAQPKTPIVDKQYKNQPLKKKGSTKIR